MAAPVHLGFPGTVDAKQQALWLPAVGGSRFGVKGPDDLKVVRNTSIDRGVTVNGGSGWGDGVYSVFDPAVPAAAYGLPAAPTGSTRWHMVVARRDWQNPYTVAFPAIDAAAGGITIDNDLKVTSGQLPAKQNNPGVTSDQPLALVEVIAGQSAVGRIIDLRVWAAFGGLVAKHELAKQYLNELGASVKIGSTVWTYELGANDVIGWTSSDKSINGGAAVDLTEMKGTWERAFTSGPRRCRVWSTDGVTAHITGLVRYKGSDANILRIPTDFAPDDGEITHVCTSFSSSSTGTVGGIPVELGIQGGLLKVVYQATQLPVNGYFPLHGSWRIKG